MNLDRVDKLKGLVSPETGRTLAEHAAAVPQDQAIVEVGSYMGKSTCYLATGAQSGNGATVYAVEPWDLEGNINGKHGFTQPETKKAFSTQVALSGMEDHIVPMQGFSTIVAGGWTGPQIGLLFIDGSHEYKDVKADYRAWAHHLAPSCVVIFDDCGGESGRRKCNQGVGKFVTELRKGAAFKEWRFTPEPLAIGMR